MPPLELKHCLVCEEIRQEVLNKLTLLGFYGVTPDVTIRVREVGKPIERLGFLLIFGSVDPGEITIRCRVEHSDGTIVSALPEARIPLPSRSERFQISFGVSNIVFNKIGTHRLGLIVNGQELRAEFAVENLPESVLKEAGLV